MYEPLKYNHDVEDWATARIAELRTAGTDAHLLISQDKDKVWYVVGVQVGDAIELAPKDVVAAWAQRIGVDTSNWKW